MLLTLLLPVCLLLNGCGDSQQKLPVDQVTILQGDSQCALPGEPFEKTLRVEVLGPVQKSAFGGKGSREPLAGEKLRFEPSPHSDLTIEPAEATTDVSGCVDVKVTAGKRTGDQYIDIIPASAPSRRIQARFISGIRISGSGLQGTAGETLAEPLKVKLVREDGTPASGVPIYFNATASPDGRNSGSVSPGMAVTDESGEATAELRTGSKTGAYHYDIEVADPGSGYYVRGLPVRALGLNLSSVVITVLGGLALFIFGMKLMSDGLQKIAGDKMKRILHFFASNGVVAVLAGTAVTAVIQSSSATTVMVIGFINAGLLNLTQGIGIIFGANIGTTITAQVISFDLGGLAMPAIFIGLLVMMLSKRNSVRGWGETIFGFGMLFFGMGIMSDELKILGDFPSFKEFFATFDCTPDGNSFMPFGAVLAAIAIGTLMTFVIQSSSAAMGIVLALAAGGLISFYTAVPLLLGTNIGTTITAFLASLAANRPAKQAALAHFLFNAIGTGIMLVLFYVPWGSRNMPIFLYFINIITPGDVFAVIPQNVERHIAMAHTLFNVLNVMLLLPFIGLFARICNFFIPIRQNEEVVTTRLEPRLLDTPSIALEQAVFAIRGMVKKSWLMVDEALNQHFMKLNYTPEDCERLDKLENSIDAQQREVTDYLVQITRRELSLPQSELVPLLMHCTNDAERIADHTANIMQLAQRLVRTDKKLSEQGRKDLKKIWSLLDELAKDVVEALGSVDNEKVRIALKNEKKINRLTAQYEEEHIERLRRGNCNLAHSVIYIEMLGELEKLGDHLSNIAERTPEIQTHYIELN